MNALLRTISLGALLLVLLPRLAAAQLGIQEGGGTEVQFVYHAGFENVGYDTHWQEASLPGTELGLTVQHRFGRRLDASVGVGGTHFSYGTSHRAAALALGYTLPLGARYGLRAQASAQVLDARVAGNTPCATTTTQEIEVLAFRHWGQGRLLLSPGVGVQVGHWRSRLAREPAFPGFSRVTNRATATALVALPVAYQVGSGLSLRLTPLLGAAMEWQAEGGRVVPGGQTWHWAPSVQVGLAYRF